jgi:hypothetical protein
LIADAGKQKNKYYISSLFDHLDEAFKNGNRDFTERMRLIISKAIVKGREKDEQSKIPY